MTLRAQWPWLSILLAIAMIVSPLGPECAHIAFLSVEALPRNIAQPLFFMGLAIFLLIVVVEWLVRLVILKRRARGTTT